MGKFLRNKDTGNIVAVGGAPVLEKTLDRKPRDCEACGFNKWIKGDKLFIVQNPSGQGMDWLCPGCALERGLPKQHYYKNRYATANMVVEEQAIATSKNAITSVMDLAACMCHF
jgi:hypothetical protein